MERLVIYAQYLSRAGHSIQIGDLRKLLRIYPQKLWISFGPADRNRTCIPRLGGMCTIHCATASSRKSSQKNTKYLNNLLGSLLPTTQGPDLIGQGHHHSGCEVTCKSYRQNDGSQRIEKPFHVTERGLSCDWTMNSAFFDW